MILIIAILVSTVAISKHEAATTMPDTFAYTPTPHWQSNAILYNMLELMVNFTKDIGVCETDVHGPKVLEQSCAGRCHQIGYADSASANCSCDYWCSARGTCCPDFSFKCPLLYQTCLKEYGFLGPFSVCQADGISAIAGCYKLPIPDPAFGLLRELLSNPPTQAHLNVHGGSENKTLRDFLGGTHLRTKDLYVIDANSKTVFKNRDVFSSCRLPNAKPLSVQRRIDLTCRGTKALNALRQAVRTTYDHTQLNNLNDYLQGCSIRKIAEESLSKLDECYIYPTIDCLDLRGQEVWSHFSELCPQNKNMAFLPSHHYNGPPDILMSDSANHVLTNGLHCFYTLPNDTDIQKQTVAFPPHDATLTIRAKSWYSRPAKEDSISYPNKLFADEKNFDRVQGFLISIQLFNLSRTIYLDCDTLDTHLSTCQSLNHEDFQTSLHAASAIGQGNKETLAGRQFSIGVAVQRVGSTNSGLKNATTVQRHSIAICTCLRVLGAFARLKTLTAKAIYSREESCDLQLQLNLTNVVEEDWSRDNTESNLETLLDIAEVFKPELELSLNQSKDTCTQDHLTAATYCLYPITLSVTDPPSSVKQLRCFHLDLTGTGQGSIDTLMRSDGKRCYVVIPSLVVCLLLTSRRVF